MSENIQTTSSEPAVPTEQQSRYSVLFRPQGGSPDHEDYRDVQLKELQRSASNGRSNQNNADDNTGQPPHKPSYPLPELPHPTSNSSTTAFIGEYIENSYFEGGERRNQGKIDHYENCENTYYYATTAEFNARSGLFVLNSRKTIAIIIATIFLISAFGSGVLLWKRSSSSSSLSLKSKSSDVLPPRLCTSSHRKLACRREFIRNMTRSAFAAYRETAWGAPELAPVSSKPYIGDKSPYPGLSIVDALSTLWVMDLKEEWAEGRAWVEASLRLGDLDQTVRVREAVTDLIGGLLSAYVLSGESLFLGKAVEVLHSIDCAFFTNTTGMLAYQINPKAGVVVESENYLANLGFEAPELIFLAQLTGDETLQSRLKQIRASVNSSSTMERSRDGLYPSWVEPTDGRGKNSASMLASEDARDFFFNMLRSYLQGGSQDIELLRFYSDALSAIIKMELFKTMGDGLVYVREYDTKTQLHDYGMDEAASQLGAMLALGAREFLRAEEQANFTLGFDYRRHWALAINVTETCYRAAMATVAKLVPTKFAVNRTLAVDAWLT